MEMFAGVIAVAPMSDRGVGLVVLSPSILLKIAPKLIVVPLCGTDDVLKH
jgi:hypothetical protein